MEHGVEGTVSVLVITIKPFEIHYLYGSGMSFNSNGTRNSTSGLGVS
jgi:hypothetical protein